MFQPVCELTQVKSYPTVIATNGDEADIYYPDLSQLPNPNFSCPMALFLQGFEVDKLYYTLFSRLIATAGFVVIVPNHIPPGRTYLAPELTQIKAILDYFKSNPSQENDKMLDRLDREKLVLFGHSCGGITGLEAIRYSETVEEISQKKYIRPPELVAGVFYGTNLLRKEAGTLTIQNSGIPIALIAGELDSIVLPELTQRTYNNIADSPKAFIQIQGINHYGITDVSQPKDGPEEQIQPQVKQAESVKIIAEWSGLFLQAYVFKQQASLDILSNNRNFSNEQVRVVCEG
ncbi:chlorophyllase/cutinase-like alpha/beta fold protein [Capilliphycus salinus ALCB114379]|uniref:poly(ethylene terephthalate) hydrolase family protein n=1 Tax=Capilliphycus salinus TaxID=2768948 RepID=UPI0039A4AA90